jgi:alpha-beta hydrolase superfamily lysophospholipase
VSLVLIAGALAAVVVATLLLPYPLIRRGAAWRRYLWLNLALLPVAFFVIVPAMLGYAGKTFIATRPDERGYAGPRLDGGGAWILQSRESLRAEGAAGTAPAPSVPPLQLVTADGVRLRAFFVPSHRAAIGASAVLVHGLFRGALELERAGALLRERGVHVLLLELRNHGGSERAAPSFGLRESEDVLAAVAWLRGDPRTRDDRIVVHAVSLGTVAATLAAPRIPDLAGLLLDAPVLDPLATAHAMLGEDRPPRRSALPQPFRSLGLAALELWCGFSFADIDCESALRQVPPGAAVLLIGGDQDERVPAATLHAAAALVPAAQREVWLVAECGHCEAIERAPDEYARRIDAWLARARAR